MEVSAHRGRAVIQSSKKTKSLPNPVRSALHKSGRPYLCRSPKTQEERIPVRDWGRLEELKRKSWREQHRRQVDIP